jgi:hypothetical protein
MFRQALMATTSGGQQLSPGSQNAGAWCANYAAGAAHETPRCRRFMAIRLIDGLALALEFSPGC